MQSHICAHLCLLESSWLPGWQGANLSFSASGGLTVKIIK